MLKKKSQVHTQICNFALNYIWYLCSLQNIFNKKYINNLLIFSLHIQSIILGPLYPKLTNHPLIHEIAHAVSPLQWSQASPPEGD